MAEKEKISKAEAVRRQLAEEPDLSNADAIALIKTRWGIDIEPQHYSTTKSQELSKQRKTAQAGDDQGEEKPAAAPRRGRRAASAPAAADLFAVSPEADGAVNRIVDAVDAVEVAQAVKALCDRYGADTVVGLAKLFGGEGGGK